MGRERTDIPTPRKRRWWLVPLILAMLAALLVADIYLLKPAIEQLSWKLASRNFDGWDIAATSENNIILVGNHILRYNGLFWYRALCFATNEQLENEDHRHWVQSTLSLRESPAILATNGNRFSDVCIYDRTHIYVVGQAGIVFYNGLWWSTMPVAEGLDPHPYQIWAQSPECAYALDRSLGILYWNGKDWDTLSLPIAVYDLDSALPTVIGGTEECVAIVGYGQTLLIKEQEEWQQVETSTLFDDIQPSQIAQTPLSLVLGEVWPLEDGRILIGIWEWQRGEGHGAYGCRGLLCYHEGVWTRIDQPQDTVSWYPAWIGTDDAGYLCAYGRFGEHYRQIEKDGTNLVWQRCDSSSQVSGLVSFVSNSKVIVYGSDEAGAWFVDWIWGLSPCRVESYELEW